MAQPKSGLRLPPPLDTARAAREGKEVVAQLLNRRPESSSTNFGEMRIRKPGAKLVLPVPLRISVAVTPEAWLTVYDAGEEGQGDWGRLTVRRATGRTNEYFLQNGKAEPRRLAGEDTFVPFAGSDFWAADLGLEFLQWPTQLLLKHAEMRRGQSCDVIESVNPNAASRGYSRVVSWIDIDTGGIVHADAYDGKNQLLKQFDPKEFRKVQGQWELEAMEMRNRQTGSRTEIRFDLGKPAQ